MKKLMVILMMIVIFLFGCGNTKNINGIEYDTYGLLNSDSKKNPEIEYSLIVGNLIWGVILCETIVAPIYFFGFSIFEPVGLKSQIKGQVVK